MTYNFSKGSEKQIAWATDILNQPIIRLENMARRDREHGMNERLYIAPVLAAKDRYIEWLTNGIKALGDKFTASWAIDRRSYFMDAADTMYRQVCKEMGIDFPPYNIR